MRVRETLRAAAVIARRDFKATVMSRAFFFFLLGPLFPVLMGLLFGGIGSKLQRDAPPPIVAVTWTATDFRHLSDVRDRLGPLLDRGDKPPLQLESHPGEDGRALLARSAPPVIAVLGGSLDRPALAGAVDPDGRVAGSVRVMVDEARRDAAAGAPEAGAPVEIALRSLDRTAASDHSGRSITAQAGQFLLFFLTLFLAGMLLSQLIEEKSNKVIEVLAAAVPVDSIFLGKLVAMLCTSLVGIAVWLTLGAAAVDLWAPNGLRVLPVPAVGWPLFLALTFVYFAMNYLIIGGLFLGIGAHATTAREVQTLSMPVTMGQIVLFSLASAGIGQPDSRTAIGAAVFPFSSAYAMLARAAELPTLWPHLAALAWQALWVFLILRFVSARFRRAVLKSGPSRRPFWRRRAA